MRMEFFAVNGRDCIYVKQLNKRFQVGRVYDNRIKTAIICETNVKVFGFSLCLVSAIEKNNIRLIVTRHLIFSYKMCKQCIFLSPNSHMCFDKYFVFEVMFRNNFKNTRKNKI